MHHPDSSTMSSSRCNRYIVIHLAVICISSDGAFPDVQPANYIGTEAPRLPACVTLLPTCCPTFSLKKVSGWRRKSLHNGCPHFLEDTDSVK